MKIEASMLTVKKDGATKQREARTEKKELLKIIPGTLPLNVLIMTRLLWFPSKRSRSLLHIHHRRRLGRNEEEEVAFDPERSEKIDSWKFR